MQNKEAIAALQEEIEGLRQDLALGVITKSEFGTERGKRLAQIDALDTRPNCLYSPEPKPGHFADPVRKARQKALDEYNNKITNLRDKGIKDSYGQPDKSTEKALSQIFNRAINKLYRANHLEVIRRIQHDAEKEVAKATQYYQKAA